MHKNFIYIDPVDKSELQLVNEELSDKAVLNGILQNQTAAYPVKNGIPDFRPDLSRYTWLEYYEKNAESYDDYNHVTFLLQGKDEYNTRENTVSRLNIKKGEKVLEIGCGTGRDSVIISKFLENTGEYYLADLSPSMLNKCRLKLKNRTAVTEFLLTEASTLPFPDNYFDKAFSFVTMSAVADKAAFLKELARVTKTGGKVIVGSEGLIPSLRTELFGKLVLNNCALYENEVPLAEIPVTARNVKIEWILNGIIFLLEFDVAERAPELPDIQIPGKRGGSLYTRYFGKLEGISPETKELAIKAMQLSGDSYYTWLNKVIEKAAQELLNNE